MFRVVSDQLKISDGWVRCGHCADVFDATLYLDTWVAPDVTNGSPPGPQPQTGASPDDALASGPAARPEEHPTWVEPGNVAQSVAESPFPVARDLSDVDADTHTATAHEDDGTRLSAPVPLEDPESAPAAEVDLLPDALLQTPAPTTDQPDEADELSLPTGPELTDSVVNGEEPVRAPLEEGDFQAELTRFSAAHETSGVTAPMLLLAPEAAEPAAADAPAAAPEPVPLAAAVEASPVADAPAEPGFVRQARRRAFWRTPAVRAVLASLGLLLTLLLAGQWALHERHDLAARHPELRPWLARLCEPLGCRVEPARRIDAIVIDSTALVRRLGNFYSFDLVLKNTAPMDLAMPALELSLTDTRDAVIARRVFLPDELPGAPALLPAQDSVAISLRLSLAVGDALPMAGYRALVFYP
jgi:predicted Zn finger-like uncharacterized protein